MEYQEAKHQFLQTWGTLGGQWGINRTMAQVHALLMISPDPVDTDYIMEELKISRGNANMNLRGLVDWGLIQRVYLPGERKDFYSAEKDVWKIAVTVAKERRKREIEPMRNQIKGLDKVSGSTKEIEHFNKLVGDIYKVTGELDQLIELLLKAESMWLSKAIRKLM